MTESLYSSCGEFLPGTYIGTLVKSRVVQSTKTRNVGVTLWWELDVPGFHETVYRTLWLSPGALPRTKRELAVLGILTLADLCNNPPVPLGSVCRLIIDSLLQRDGYYETQIIRWDVLDLPIVGEEGCKDGRC
jgi:hypothetical protein